MRLKIHYFFYRRLTAPQMIVCSGSTKIDIAAVPYYKKIYSHDPKNITLDSRPACMKSIRLAAKQENLDNVLKAISMFAERNDFSPAVVGRIKLSLEEALVNIMNYAYPQSEGEVAVYYTTENDTKLILKIQDKGVPLDPLSLPEPDFSATLAERKVGGLGVYFIRKMTDEVRYQRQGDANILTLIYSK